MAKKKSKACPCGSGQNYALCCGRFIEGDDIPETPEQLMRSRYTAYLIRNEAYLLDTWHPSTRPSSLFYECELPVKWVRLSVINAIEPGPSEVRATVEFDSYYKLMGKLEQMHEVSEFIKEAGRWFYVSRQRG